LHRREDNGSTSAPSLEAGSGAYAYACW
jgi:hypothetical protein